MPAGPCPDCQQPWDLDADPDRCPSCKLSREDLEAAEQFLIELGQRSPLAPGSEPSLHSDTELV